MVEWLPLLLTCLAVAVLAAAYLDQLRPSLACFIAVALFASKGMLHPWLADWDWGTLGSVAFLTLGLFIAGCRAMRDEWPEEAG